MLLNAFERAIARRYLTSRRKDGFISLTAILSAVAIGLGVAALIVVMSVMNGFRVELLDKILGYHGHMLVQGYGGQIEGYRELERDVAGVDHVKRTLSFVESQVMVTKDGRAWGGIARGYPDAHFNAKGIGIQKVHAGNLATAKDFEGLVLGYELAKRLGVTAGDLVTIVSPKMMSTPFGSTLRYQAYPILAVVEVGVYQFDESFIGMPLGLAQRFFGMGDTVSTIEVFIDDPEDVDRLEPAFKKVIGDRAHITHWKRFNSAIVGALQTERVVMFLVVMLIIVVAVFNIASSLFMLVKDKSSDIAILCTMGASSTSILKIFIAVGVAVGVLGILMGSMLATLLITYLPEIKSGVESMFGLNLWDPSVRFVSEMKAVVVWEEVAFTVGSALILSFLATIPPARRAAKLDPIDILRYE